MAWKTIKSEKIIDEYHVKVLKSEVQLSDGAVIPDFYTVTIPDAAMICALTTDGNIILKSEYRYAIGTDVIECPAGMFEESETNPLVVAKRELLEETGFESESWTYFGPTLESTSKLTNRMHLFLAKNCIKTSSHHLDINEHVDIITIPFSTAIDMVMEGKINANSTAHLILKVARTLGEI